MTVKLSFNTLLEEAKREPVELEMPDGAPIVVEFPTGDGAKALKAAIATGNEDRMLAALVGEDAARRLLALFPSAPGDMDGRVVKAIMEGFGMPKDFFSSAA